MNKKQIYAQLMRAGIVVATALNKEHGFQGRELQTLAEQILFTLVDPQLEGGTIQDWTGEDGQYFVTVRDALKKEGLDPSFLGKILSNEDKEGVNRLWNTLDHKLSKFIPSLKSQKKSFAPTSI